MTFRIGSKTVGPGHPAYLIAEIGSNHDGSLRRAESLIAAAAKAGADAVKFQSFTADGLYVRRTRQGRAWKDHPVWSVLGKYALPNAWLAPLTACARKHGVAFMSTPFDFEALEAMRRLRLPAYKIASGDLTHHELIRKAARTGRPVLIATGMATEAEVAAARDCARAAGAGGIALLHCVSLYPPRFDEMNVRTIPNMIARYRCPIGFSDHTPGWAAVVGAVALGATVIEKHVTTDRKRKGPDHPYALEMEEFGAMVRAVRELEAALGDGKKRPMEREVIERTNARRGLFAAADIRAASVVSAATVKAVRPAVGLGADRWDEVVGSVARRDIERDEPLDWSLLRRAGRSGRR